MCLVYFLSMATRCAHSLEKRKSAVQQEEIAVLSTVLYKANVERKPVARIVWT